MKRRTKTTGNWSKLSQAEIRREKFLLRRENYLRRASQQRIACYEPGNKGLSAAEFVIRDLRVQHPGNNMFYYASMFLGDMNCSARNFHKMYTGAIKFAFDKYISGRVHYTEKDRKTAENVKDAEQLMLECLRASGKKGTVENYLREIILN